MQTVCLIPARMGSSRFPGKPLAPLLGLPMILHIYERCRLFTKFDFVAVATCDAEIFDRVVAYGGEVVMTSDSHERATDRVQEASMLINIELSDDDFVLMVQGDEIFVSPEMVEQAVAAYIAHRNPVTNLVTPLFDPSDIDDPNTVKVAGSFDGRALYMSRSRIPSDTRGQKVSYYQQTGIIGFSTVFLHKFSELAPTPLEAAESIDMLRAIEHGYTVELVYSDVETIGIDTREELERAEERLRHDSITQTYLGKN